MFTAKTEGCSRWLNTLHRRHEWLVKMGARQSAKIVHRLIILATHELLSALNGEGC